MNRFWNQVPRPRDSEIVKRATRLKMEFYKDSDGDLHGEFTIGGGFGMFSEEDCADPDDFAKQQRDAMRFVKELLAEFERKPEEGGCDG